MSERKPLDPPTKERMLAYYEAVGRKYGITASRALYNSSKIMGNSADAVDQLFGYVPGTAAAWVIAHGLPPLDGVVKRMTLADIEAVRKL